MTSVYITTLVLYCTDVHILSPLRAAVWVYAETKPDRVDSHHKIALCSMHFDVIKIKDIA